MDKLYSTAQLAALLGKNVHTIRKYVRDGRIQAIQLNKKDYLFTEETINSFLKNHTIT